MTGTLSERRPPGRLAAGLPTSFSALPLWARAALVFVALRVVTWLLMAQAADHAGYYPGVQGPAEGHVDLALNWDAVWYQRIFDHGYPDQLPVGDDGRVQQNEWAFYPVYPYAVRLMAALLGSDFATVAPALALLAGLGAAVVMARLLVETLPAAPARPRRTEALALAAVGVWAACPVTPVLQMAYTESFSVLLLVTFLLLLVRERWWAAGACAVVLGLTRPIALPLVVVVLVALWMRWQAREERPLPTGERVAMTAALGLTGLSGLLWTAIAAVGAGRRDAYPATMTAWRGEDRIAFLEPWKRTITYAWETHDKVFVLPALGIAVPLVLSLLLLVPRIGGGLDLRLRVWSAAYSVYLLAVVDGHTSIFRYLVALFPLAVLLVGAHRPEPRAWQLRTTVWVVVGIVGQVGWIWWLVVFSPLPGGYGDYPP
ncbi:hypothetical protein [Nocardioides rubriscoriae]|uniref:hypothetical protein n=1 Tax=Nocardioides rubriscoriae TaxID=642762 RepID=UPI0011E0328A|nr:hypothetical protein [Nocardioides rubriscoriae]